MKNLFLSALVVLFLVSCGGGGSSDTKSPDDKSPPVKEEKVAFRVLDVGKNFGVDTTSFVQGKTIKLIHNEEALKKAHTLFHSSNQMPQVDFSKNDVLAIFRGVTTSGEYISLKDLRKEGETLTAYIDGNFTGGLCGVENTINSVSYAFIEYPKTRNVVFKESYGVYFERNKNCPKGEEKKPKDVSFTKLVYMVGDMAEPKHSKQYELIRTQKRLNEVYDYNDSSTSSKKPSVDFEKEAVLYLVMGYFPTGGYDIGVTKVTKYEHYTQVDVKTTYSGDHCPVTEALTAPRLFVKISREDSGNVIFNETKVKAPKCK